MERTVHAPDWEWGSADQCAAWLNIEATAFRAWVKGGKVPAGVEFNRQNVRWHWSVIHAISVLALHLADPAVKPKGAQNSTELGTN